MAVTKYTRFRPEDLDDLSLSDLMQELADYLLDSGFQDVYGFNELSDQTLDELRRAILRALMEQGAISTETVERMLEEADSFEESELARMLDRLIERMQNEGFISITPPEGVTAALDPETEGVGDVSDASQSSVRFQLTDKSVDFLGYKSLKDLLGGLGRSSFGQHETKELATGVEVLGSSKRYEFGDTLTSTSTSRSTGARARQCSCSIAATA